MTLIYRQVHSSWLATEGRLGIAQAFFFFCVPNFFLIIQKKIIVTGRDGHCFYHFKTSMVLIYKLYYVKVTIMYTLHHVPHSIGIHGVRGSSMTTKSSLLDSVTQWALGRGHTKKTGNHNATANADNCDQPDLNTCYWLEQRKLRKRQRNSRKDWVTQIPGKGVCQSSHTCFGRVVSWC
jgi:hypothetical protein